LSNGSATTPTSTTTGNNSLKGNNRPKQQGSMRLQMAANSAPNGSPTPAKQHIGKSEARAATHSSIKLQPTHQINTPTGHCLAQQTTSWTFTFYLSISLLFSGDEKFSLGGRLLDIGNAE
jgi:hypothetical protein